MPNDPVEPRAVLADFADLDWSALPRVRSKKFVSSLDLPLRAETRTRPGELILEEIEEAVLQLRCGDAVFDVVCLCENGDVPAETRLLAGRAVRDLPILDEEGRKFAAGENEHEILMGINVSKESVILYYVSGVVNADWRLEYRLNAADAWEFVGPA